MHIEQSVWMVLWLLRYERLVLMHIVGDLNILLIMECRDFGFGWVVRRACLRCKLTICWARDEQYLF